MFIIILITFHNSFNKIDYCVTRCRIYISDLLLDSGFSIDKIVITGNKFTNENDILSLIDRTQPIVYISLSKLVNSIYSMNGWIKDVKIYRILPNTLYINIDEYKIFIL
ncbi:MAG: FtsQ-type POTRA domain-containing protein [Wolbachia endosymbiont of Menacanthus eurysternus]|nr:MAG: FtsQ-type POTRA domain-containing protein [Wolbachia endosymbiont of Menacanthus eurysternus]